MNGKIEGLPFRLETLRAAKGFTQQSLAAAADVSVSTVTNAEAGRTVPSLGLALRLAAALGVTVDEMCGPTKTK